MTPGGVALRASDTAEQRSSDLLRMQAVFESALDAIFLINAEARIVDANPAACDLLGRPRRDILTSAFWEIAPLADREAARATWSAFLMQGRLSGEFRVGVDDGSTRQVEFRSIANVLPGLHLSILRDVTERTDAQRNAEQGLRYLNDQLRRVSARARARREEDRTRLARELHDQLGQALAGLKIDLFWLADRIGPTDAGDVTDKIGAMTRLVDETIMRVRRLSSELRPPVLDRLGLIAAIEWQIDEFEKRTQIHVRLRSSVDQVPLDRGRSTAVFRIFQEALTNVAAHSGATQVTVRLSTRDGRLLMVIADNGCGITVRHTGSRQSLGLIGMHERAELLGGEVRIGNGRSRGTIVHVSIPIDDRRRTPRDPWV